MADSAIPVTPGTGASVDTQTQANGDHRQVTVLGDATSASTAKVGVGGDQTVSISSPSMSPFGVSARVVPFGALRITGEPTSVLYEVFDGTTIDANRWNTSGTVVPTQSTGYMTVAPGTTNGATSVLSSVPLFSSPGLGYHAFASIVTLETAQVTNPNVHRFWGIGVANSYAATTPLTEAIGFEVDLTGALSCVVYVGGVRYVVQSTNPTLISSSAGTGGTGTAVPTGAVVSTYGKTLAWQGGTHRFGMHVRSDSVFFYIEGQDSPIAAANYLLPNVQALPLRVAGVTAASGTVSPATTFQINSIGMGDTTGGNSTISDGDYPWRRAEVGRTGGLSMKGAGMDPVATTIPAASTGTAGPVLVDEAGNATIVVKNASAATAWTGTPILVFEQSDDGVSWGVMPVARSDNGAVRSTHILPAGTANGAIVFNVALGGVRYVRVRVTTGTATGALTIVVQQGGLAFQPTVGIQEMVKTRVVYYAPATAGTTAEALLSLTRQSAGVTGTASTTPAVIATGRTFRAQRMDLTYIASATTAYALVRLRFNPSGVVSTTSPIAAQVAVGATTPASANSAQTVTITFDEGMDFPAGAGLGITIAGFSGVTASASGYVVAELTGYEY